MRTTIQLIAIGLLGLGVGCGSDPGDGGNSDGDGGTDGRTDGGTGKDGGTGPRGDGGTLKCTELRLIIRDFKKTAFEASNRDSCDASCDFEHPLLSDDEGPDVAIPNIVQETLGPERKPEYAPSTWVGKEKIGGDGIKQIQGPDTFKQWYTDDTKKLERVISLTRNAMGRYEYDSAAFFPIDDDGHGSEGFDRLGNKHNFGFTTEVHTSFTYRGGEVFTFRGDDDLWLFINDKLAIDLGGMHGPQEKTVDLDADKAKLGIETGRRYKMDIFHAERHTTASNFRVETSIQCFID